MQLNDIENLLKPHESFQNLTESSLGFIYKNSNLINLKAGSTLFNEGDKDTKIYIVVEGSLEAYCNDELNEKSF